MEKIIESAVRRSYNGTISSREMVSVNDASSFKIAVKGNEIFQLIANEVKYAEYEVLIQTFAWEKSIRGVQWLKEALVEVCERKREEDKPIPLKVYLQIDERGPIANLAFTGKLSKNWKLDAESIGLIYEEGLVEVYVSTYFHDNIAGNHAKTIIIDGKTLIITGANFQSSNFHFIPAHDAAYCIKGPIALQARKDFEFMWNKRKNRFDTPDIFKNMSKDIFKNIKVNFENYEYPLQILLTTRKPQVIRSFNFLDNPQNSAINSLITNAKKKIKIATPNLNAPFVTEALINFINKGFKAQIMLGKSFNDKRESTLFLGGTNQFTVDELYNKVKQEQIHNLDIRWFTLNYGEEPVVGNVAGACHLKFMQVDNQFLMVGNANLDIAGTTHLHEVNIVINSVEITKQVTEKVFKEEFKRAIKAEPSENILERLKHASGIKGYQENLAPKYKVKILEIKEEEDGFKTFKLERPDRFKFEPGQYINVRSGKTFDTMVIKPLQLAISSGIHEDFLEITSRASSKSWKPNYCLYRKKIGQTLEIEGPMGTSFPFPEIKENERILLLLIGGGSGITPLRSVMKSLPANIPHTLVYSTKTFKSLLYKENVHKWINNSHVVSLTQENQQSKDYQDYQEIPDFNLFYNERTTSILTNMKLDENIKIFAFICGSIELVKDVRKVLVSKHIPLENIFVSLSLGALQKGPVYRGDDPFFA